MKAIVNAAVCPLKAEPKWESTLADEVLYGMVVDILEEAAPGWVKVRTHYRYEGYAPKEQLIVGDEAARAWEALPRRVVRNKNCCDALSIPKVQGCILQSVTRGAVLGVGGEAENGWQKVVLADGREGFVQASILGAHFTAPCCEDEAGLRRAIAEAALLYRGTHYRWGGKSPLGIDCSGLASMAYMLCGICIYRDADIVEGFPIHEYRASACARAICSSSPATWPCTWARGATATPPARRRRRLHHQQPRPRRRGLPARSGRKAQRRGQLFLII